MFKGDMSIANPGSIIYSRWWFSKSWEFSTPHPYIQENDPI